MEGLVGVQLVYCLYFKSNYGSSFWPFNSAYFNSAYFNSAYFNSAYFNSAYFNSAYFNSAHYRTWLSLNS